MGVDVLRVHEAGGRRDHKVVLVRSDGLRPLDPPEAYKAVPRRVRGLDGHPADLIALGRLWVWG